MKTNTFGQPVGEPLPGWSPRPRPERTVLQGASLRIEPLEPKRHGDALYGAFQGEDADWTYLSYGPFASFLEFESWLAQFVASDDPLTYALIDLATGKACGMASLMRIEPEFGSIEVGHIHYGRELQRRRGATEAMYLLMRYAFEDLGYRRYEWKCDALNEPSRRAAERLGFTFEGIFRQALIYKQRNRDTAWFSIVDREWPALRSRFERWLADDNFDSDGRQRSSL